MKNTNMNIYHALQNSSVFYQILPQGMRNKQAVSVLFHCSPWAKPILTYTGSITKLSDKVLPTSYHCGKHSQRYPALYWQQYNQQIHTRNYCLFCSLWNHIWVPCPIWASPSNRQTLIPEQAQRKPSKIEYIMYKQKRKEMGLFSLK